MSRTIELPDEVYARVEAEAKKAGVSVTEWIIALAAAKPPAINDDRTREEPIANGNGKPRTLADEFAGRVGLISSGRGDLAQRAGELFATGMVEKRQRGHL